MTELMCNSNSIGVVGNQHAGKEERIQISKECLESGNNYGEIAKKYEVSYMDVEIQGIGRIGAGRPSRQAQVRTEATDQVGTGTNPNRTVGTPVAHGRNGEPSVKKLREIERRESLGK